MVASKYLGKKIKRLAEVAGKNAAKQGLFWKKSLQIMSLKSNISVQRNEKAENNGHRSHSKGKISKIVH